MVRLNLYKVLLSTFNNFFQYFCRFLPKEFQFGTLFVIVQMSLTKIPLDFFIKKIWVSPKKIV